MSVLPAGLHERLRQTGRALGNRDLARLLAVWALWVTVDWATLITISLLALQAGGPAAVGLVGAVRVLPAVVLSAPASLLTDRWSRSRLLALVCAASGVLAALLAWCAVLDVGLPVLLTVIAAGAAVGVAVKPTLQAVVPTLVASPADLVAANSAYAVIEGLGTVLGPGLCAALLGLVGPPGVLGVLAALLGVAAVVSLAVRSPFQPVRRRPDAARDLWLAPFEGFRVLARPGLRVAVSLFMAQTLVRGLLNVFVVLVATSTDGGSQARAGSLFIAMGVGGLVGSAAALGLGPRRPSRWIAVGIVLWGAPLVALGVWPAAAPAAAALAVVGFGNAILDVSGYTLVNRLVPDHLAGRAWGAFAALAAAVVAAGSLAAPVLVEALGLTGALVLTGFALALSPALVWVRLSRLDALASGRVEDVELLRRVPLFAALSLVALERLARGAGGRDAAVGEVVVRQGDPGTAFFVVAAGEVVVERDGREVRRLGPAEAFGEIALLGSGRRTATVAAAVRTRLLVLDRESFVAAVTGHQPTDALARQRVGELRLADEQRWAAEDDGRPGRSGRP